VAVLARLGVLGGSFDPIHIGHLLLGQTVAEALSLDLVLFVPAGMPPHKIGKRQEDPSLRLKMVQASIADNHRFSASTVDLNRPAPQYTADTLSLLRDQYGLSPESLYFILGSDSLEQLHTWHLPGRVAEECRLVVVKRPGFAMDLDEVYRRVPQTRGRVDVVEMPELGISSSMLREMVRDGRSLRYWVPGPVETIIAEEGLYMREPSLVGGEV
jgi:nicotinate-nucleotide adenylyltransferase